MSSFVFGATHEHDRRPANIALVLGL